MFRRPTQKSLLFPLILRCRVFLPICLTSILLLLTTSRFSLEKCLFRRCRVKVALPLSTRSVGCEKNTWKFGRVLVMALLCCNRSSRIPCDVLETRSFIPICKIMTSGFIFQIGIMWWLIFAKVTPLKSYTFTKRFLLSLFSSIPVIIESPTRIYVPAGHACLISWREASFIVQFSSETSLLVAFWKRSNCWRFCCLYSAICLILVNHVWMLAQFSLSLTICCLKQSPANGSIFSL